MNNRPSPYHQPGVWLLRETSIIGLLMLGAWVVAATGLESITKLLAFIVLLVLIVAFTMRVVADLLAAGFCRWSAAMGHGLGALVASIRQGRRKA